MICHVVRYQHNQATQWGVLYKEFLYPLKGQYDTTADFLLQGREEAYSRLKTLQQGSDLNTGIDQDNVNILSPITKGQKVLCQGANYRQHMIESGMDPDAKHFNMFFHKSSASICSATDDIHAPDFVQLLDYEIELGLVIGNTLEQYKTVTRDNIHELVAGIVMANDISARDIQIPQMQFFKGKSYRTFCPTGPVLCLLEAEDMHYLHNLNLELRVNDGVRQQDSTKNLVFKPEESLTEFSQVTDFAPGDIVLTGTPSGCALQLPKSALKRKLFHLLPEEKKWSTFINAQGKSNLYLKAGHRLSASIKSPDGAINLGKQSNKVI